MRDTCPIAISEPAQPRTTLKLCAPHGYQTQRSGLPILTSANDIREFVQYLKRQPTGVVPAEELDRSRRRLFDERKLSAYRKLGITEEHQGLLTLSPFGRSLAARLEPETQGFRQLLTGMPLYVAAVEWMYEQHLEVVTSTDLIAFWLTRDNGIDEFHKPDSSRGAAISFFSLCEAAELGTLTFGKRGHTTRLNIDRQELARFVAAQVDEGLSTSHECDEAVTENPMPLDAVLGKQRELRMLVVNSGNTTLVDLIRKTLDLINTIQVVKGEVSQQSDLDQPDPYYLIDIT